VLKRIVGLVDDPRPRQSLKLSGADSIYRLRIGDYRVIFEIDDSAELVSIMYVRHRRDAYRDL
jgi:mRNA interferase RelE/StbE